MTTAASRHEPVMVNEVVAALAPRDGGYYVDGTFGGGGYSRAILKAARCRVLGLDRDPAAIARGADLVRESDGRLSLVEARFSALETVVADVVDGIALDLGISSDQLDAPSRGFSFAADGPLDMRLSPTGPTAADLVNGLSEVDLARLLRTYGEERKAGRIARHVCAARAKAPILRTRALADIVVQATGERPGAAPIHPATRTFQALRIAVNDELAELARGLAAAERVLKPAGRLVVVAFHSLEDRIVKQFLSARAGRGGAPSRHRPLTEGAAPSFTVLSGRAAKPGADEVARNPRARSARLRAAARTAAPAHSLDLSLFDVPSFAVKGAPI